MDRYVFFLVVLLPASFFVEGTFNSCFSGEGDCCKSKFNYLCRSLDDILAIVSPSSHILS